MGVQIKMANQLDVFSAAGVDGPHLAKAHHLLKSPGVTLSVEFYKVAFTKTPPSGKALNVGVTLPCITTSLVKGTAIQSQVSISKMALEKMIDSAMEHFGVPPLGEVEPEKLSDILEAAYGILKKKSETNPEAPKPHVDDAEVIDEAVKGVVKEKVSKSKIASSDPVPLREATFLLQPVLGTDATSVYHVVALSKDVNIAARVKANAGVSVRAEGPMPMPVKKALGSLGFKNSTEHMSIHLSGADGAAGKIIGGLLYQLGLEFDKQIAADQIKLVKGK